MRKTEINIDYESYPDWLSEIIKGSKVYDSSSSPEARVIFIDKGDGYFLKTAEKGSLKREAEMTEYFYNLGLSANVLEYMSEDKDYLLTNKIKGEDCTHYEYLENPKRLCDMIAEQLFALHHIPHAGCPAINRTDEYLRIAEHNYINGIFDPTFVCNRLKSLTKEELWNFVKSNKNVLKSDVLIHGDYCLPNILFNKWNFSGFIDVGCGGVSDKHIDLFWGAWTLGFNLKTDKFKDRFFDAYGRNNFEIEIVDLVSVIETFG